MEPSDPPQQKQPLQFAQLFRQQQQQQQPQPLQQQPPPQIVQQLVQHSQQQPAAAAGSAAANGTNNNGRIKANEAQLRLFFRGLDAVLQQWTALNLICRHDAQTQAKDQSNAVMLRDELRQWFAEDGEIYADELEDFFFDFFDNAHASHVEDGSLKEVGEVLSEMFRQCCQNRDDMVVRFEQTLIQYQQSNTLSECVHFQSPDDDDDDDENCDGAAGDDYDDDDDDDGDDYARDDDDDHHGYDNEHGDDAALGEDGGGRVTQQESVIKKKKPGGGGGGAGWKTVSKK